MGPETHGPCVGKVDYVTSTVLVMQLAAEWWPRYMALKSVPPSMNTPEMLVLVLVLAGCATGQDSHDKSGEDLFFLKQIFNKYGDHGVISFEVMLC